MAILICSNESLRDPEIWDMISDFSDSMEVVKHISNGTVMRIKNNEVPEDDYLMDLEAIRITGIRPFIVSFNVYQLYQP